MDFSFFSVLIAVVTPNASPSQPYPAPSQHQFNSMDGFLCLWPFRAHPSGKTCHNACENSPVQEAIPDTLP